MDRLISCEFNMDTACVELKFADGGMIAIDTTLIAIGLIFGTVGIVVAYWKYTRKDIHSA